MTSIDAILLVINGREARMNANLAYVLTQLTSILPKAVLDNVIPVYTNTADPLDLNFDPDELQKYFGKRIEKCLFIENPYCRIEKAKAKQHALDMSIIARSLQKSFEETRTQLTNLFEYIKGMTSVHTYKFLELYEKKQDIDRKMLEILAELDNQHDADRRLQVTEQELSASERTSTLNRSFTSTKSIKKWITVSTPTHNTLCGAPRCYSNCHEECYLPKSLDKDIFKLCACMRDTNGDLRTVCQVAGCGHPYSFHYHNEVLWKQKNGDGDIHG